MRADALDFLHALHGLGTLVAAEEGREVASPVRLSTAPWPDDLDFDWRFVGALATLTEWSGSDLEVPELASANEVRDVLQAADWVSTQRIDATVTGPFHATLPADPASTAADQLQVEQDFGLNFQGIEIPLGTGTASLAVDVTVATPSQTLVGGSDVVLTPRPDNESVVFYLRPPATRRLPPHRTQIGESAILRSERDENEIPPLIERFLERFGAARALRPPSDLAQMVPSPVPDTARTASRFLDELREE